MCLVQVWHVVGAQEMLLFSTLSMAVLAFMDAGRPG